jgi:DNA-binding CsgD family transcriptional regulator
MEGTTRPRMASEAKGSVLLERERELARIGELLREAASGGGRALFVEGPAGIGKTELLRHAGDMARDEGMQVATARGGEVEGDLAFGIVRELFEPHPAHASAAEREDLLAGPAALAAPILGAEGAAPAATDLSSVLYGLYWLCSNLAERRALLLAVDDCHWADYPSIRFLAYLAHRIEGLPALLAVARRTGEAGGAEELLEAIRAEPVCTVIRPQPLSQDASRTVVAASLAGEAEPEFAEACHDASAGNPFFLHELLAALHRDGVQPTAEEAERVRQLQPETIALSTAASLGRLAAPAPGVARAVAVLGSGAELRHAAELAEATPEEAGEAVDALIDGAFLAPGRPLEFVHPVVRSAVYADLPAGLRSQLHARAAHMLDGESVAPERVAGHLLHTEALSEGWVVDTLRKAAYAAMDRGAPETAAIYLRRALAEPPSAEAMPEVRLELGAAAARAGAQDAEELLMATLTSAERPDLRVGAAVELGQVMAYAGRIDEAAGIVRQVLDGIDPDEKQLVRPLEMMLAVLAQTSLPGRRVAKDLVDRAAAVVDRLGERAPRGLRALVSVERGLVTGEASDAGDLADAALADGRLLVEQTAEAPHAYFASAILAIADRAPEADRYLSDAIGQARERGSSRAYAFASAMRALIRYRLGFLDEAEADGQACIELAAHVEWQLFQPAAVSTLIDVRVERGELDGADEALAALDEEVQDRDSVLYQPLRVSAARLRLAQRRPEEAVSFIDECAAWEAEWGERNPVWPEWRLPGALTREALGDPESALRLADEQLEGAGRFGSARTLGRALRVRGLLSSGESSIELLREAAEVLSRSTAALDHAHALVDLGAALRRENQRSAARDPLRQGLDAAHRLGATALAARARDELRATGARPRSVVLTGVESLTASELRVARMAAEGMGNREIAQALFVTRKTVEGHLSNCYRKLDVSSRDELPQALERPSA